MTSYGTYLSASAIRVNSLRIDTISNNVANIETGGFKRALAEVVGRPAEARGGPIDLRRRPDDAVGGGPFVQSTRFDLSQGIIEPTGRPLDVALQGDGFLVARQGVGDKGPLRLTRDGNLFVGESGDLVTHQGHAVLDTDGRRINLAGINQGDLKLDVGGTIYAGPLPVARLAIRLPEDPAVLTPTGGNLFDPQTDTFNNLAPAAGVAVRGGMLERSNVSPETELIRLLDAQRQLEANATFLQFQDQATGKAVNEVGRIA